jgi:hypothetical protein
MKQTNIIVLIFLFSSFLLNAQTKFYTQVSSNDVSVGEHIQVSFVLENARGSNFKPPSFKGFSVLSGPNQSQSTQWINGQMSSSITYYYIISADVPGNFTINSAYITVDGKRLKTQPVKIRVSKGSKPKNNTSSGETDLNDQAEKIVRKNLFLKLYVNKAQAYEGEPIVATYKLYVHPELQLVNLAQPKMPTFNGFWTQDLGDSELKFFNETLNGVLYRVAVLKKVVLLPQQSGELKIEPMEIESVVRFKVRSRRRSNNPFDDPFFDSFFNSNYRDFRFTIRSGSSKISVKPLPSGAPESFAGAVGRLQLKSRIDKRKVKTGDAVTLKITISGYGNLKLIEPLPLDLPPDIDMYDPKISDNIKVSASGMSGSKTFEYYLIPLNPGKYKIKPVTFTYFDLSEKKYKTLQSDEFVLDVSKGSGNAATVVSGVNKKDVEFLGKDIRFIKTNWSGEVSSIRGFAGSALFYILLILPFPLFILVFFFAKRREELQRDKRLLRNRKANAVAKKRLAEARKFADNNMENEFYEEISKALSGYVADKLSIPYAEFTRDKAAEELKKRNIDDEIIEKLLTTIDYCDSVRYAPATERMLMKEVYDKASEVIMELEGVLK